MLGDQPGVTSETVKALLAGRGEAHLRRARTRTGAVIHSHSRRGVFGDLAELHGDKGVWKLLDRRAGEVVDVPIAGRVPLDVDTVGGLRSGAGGSRSGLA